jgi:hypothetical protein
VITLAFKIAAASDSQWSKLVAHASGSIYSHVEGWLDGPKTNARCFSSREPHGAGFEQIDLTTPGLWDFLPFPCTPDQEMSANGFCLGADGKLYDGVGLLGFKLADPAIHDYHALFCSETWAAIAQKCCGRPLPKVPWLISPGELYTLAKGWNGAQSG